MVQKITLFLLLNMIAYILSAQESKDTAEAVDTAILYEYRLSEDVFTNHVKTNETLLKGRDHLSKSNFLNHLKIELKSGYSSTSTFWKLDSIVVKEYNETSQQIENLSRQTLSTENSGQTILVKDYYWVTEQDHWLINDANYYYLSETGRLDSIEFQEYVTINYRMYTKTYYGYEDGLLRTEWSKEKFDEFDDWTQISRLEYQYDTVRRLKQVNTMEWDEFDDRWSTFEILEYEYDSLGNTAAEIAYDYDSYEMVRTKKYEIVYSYNEQNLLTDVTEYVEGWGEGNFIPDRKLSYEYDELMNLTTETLYSWDYDLDNWLELSRKQHFYEVSDDQVHEILLQSWDDQWNDVTNTEFFSVYSIVPEEVNNQEFVFSFLPMLIFDNQVVDKLETYSYSGGEWLARGITSYHFTQNSPVGISSEYLTDLNIFPNPATDYIQIQTTSLQPFECIVYDLSGKTMIQENSIGSLRLNVSGLKSGYYLINVREEGEKVSKGKFIKF